MDEQLQKLKRQALTDPDAKDKYITMLERLLGVRDQCSLWVVNFIIERSDLSYTLGIYLTKDLAQKAAADNIINMMCEDLSAGYNDETEREEEQLSACRALYQEGRYSDIIDFFQYTWCDYTHEVRIEETLA